MIDINLFSDPNYLFGDNYTDGGTCDLNDEHEEYELHGDALYASYNKYKKILCGIGTRSLKWLLSGLAKAGDLKASVYKALLDVETYHYYSTFYYDTQYRSFGSWYKYKLYKVTQGLIDSIKRYNTVYSNTTINFGYKKNRFRDKLYLVIVDIDGIQTSFHTYIEKEDMCNIDEYIGKWSGTTEFNFEKLEDAIYNMYSLEIEKKTLKTDNNLLLPAKL